MMPDEKTRLLELLAHSGRWCQGVEAHDAQGDAVTYDDERAVAWDITGALCRLFGWERSRVLFEQLDRHVHGKRNTLGWPPRNVALDAMAALQEFNDRSETTFDLLRERIESMPVWHGNRQEVDTPDA